MDFNWIGFFFWLLIGIGFLLLVYGIWKRSWKALIFSGLALFLPMLYFITAVNWLRLLALVPAIPFVIAAFLMSQETRDN